MFLWHVCLNNTSSKSLLFIFLLDETEMAQHNSVFVFAQKTSNDSCGRPDLKTDMNQVKNLKSLSFTWKKIANLRGVSTSFWFSYFCNRPFCGKRCCKTSICISCCKSRWFTYTNAMKLSAITFPLSTSCTGEQFF